MATLFEYVRFKSPGVTLDGRTVTAVIVGTAKASDPANMIGSTVYTDRIEQTMGGIFIRMPVRIGSEEKPVVRQMFVPMTNVDNGVALEDAPAPVVKK